MFIYYGDLMRKAEQKLRDLITPTDGSPLPPFGFHVALPIDQGAKRWQRFQARLHSYVCLVETNTLFEPEPVFPGETADDVGDYTWVWPRNPPSLAMGALNILPDNQGIVAQLTDLHEKDHRLVVRCSSYNDVNSTIKTILEAMGSDASNLVNGMLLMNPVGGAIPATTQAAKGAIDTLLKGISGVVFGPENVGDAKNVVLVDKKKPWLAPDGVTSWVGYKLVVFEREVEKTVTVGSGANEKKETYHVLKYSNLTMWRLSLSTTSDFAYYMAPGPGKQAAALG